MHRQAEAMATEAGARRMKTATSQPGFFKKMGYDYTAKQKALNVHLGTDVMQKAETRQEKGGSGFLMEKDLRRVSKCSIM